MTPLISVHVAKAGGSSMLRMLKIAYGDSFLADYSDDPANPLGQRVLDPDLYLRRKEYFPKNISCIHGHFHPGKYDIRDGTVLSTILRHPIDNIISIFFFWKTLDKQGNKLHDYFIDNQLTIGEMARLPLLRRLYSKTYFEGFDMGRFDLIGRHDSREAALKRLSDLIGTSLDITIRENVTEASEERREMESNLAFQRELEDILADDIKFYERFAR